MIAAALLAACEKSAVPTRTGGAPARKSPAAARPSQAPGGQPAAAVADGPDVLRKPTRASLELSGRIALDARYAVGTGLISDRGGAVVANNGGGIISDQGAGVLSVNGAQLLSNNAGNLVSRNAAGIVSHNGAGLTAKVKFISDQGGGIVANNGGGFISDQGGGIVSNNSGGLVSNNGPSRTSLSSGAFLRPGDRGGAVVKPYDLQGLLAGLVPTRRLAAAGGLPHQAFPVGGMLVGVISLADGAYLPLGVDREGKPIYAVFTDAEGGFKVHLPAGLAKNVLVVSSVPGTSDPRLAVDLVASGVSAGGLVVDDASTVATTYLRQSIVARLEEAMDPDPCRPAPTGDSLSRGGFALTALTYQDVFGAAFKALPRPARQRVMARFTDAAIGLTDLATVTINPSYAEASTATGLAMPVLRRVLAEMEAAVAKHLEASPTYFDDKPYVLIANRERGSGPPYVIRKPADFSEFVVRAYLATSDLEVTKRLAGVIVDLGLSPALREDMTAAGGSLFAGLVPTIAGPENLGEERIRAAARAAIADEAAASAPVAEPTCMPAAVPPVVEAEVTSLAGTGEGGFTDGPGATARFKRPSRLAYDPRGFLFVSELEGGRIRRIDLNDPAHPVTTIAGTGEEGWLDGPAKAAQFHEPSGLALDGRGALYVVERANHRVRKIVGYDGADAVVSTVAGDGTAGYTEGAGAAARFNQPEDVAIGPDGALYVADLKNHRVRKVTADGHVTTYFGSGEDTVLNGVALAATVREPRGLSFTPRGDLLVVDSKDARVRIVNPAGGVAFFAGSGDAGLAEGSYYTARFQTPYAAALTAAGEVLLADARNHRIRLLDRQGFVSTVAGSGPGGQDAGAFAEGRGGAAAFNTPTGIAIAGDGTVYVADSLNHRIRVLRLPAP